MTATPLGRDLRALARASFWPALEALFHRRNESMQEVLDAGILATINHGLGTALAAVLTEAADKVWAELRRIRLEARRAAAVSVEYINGWEDATGHLERLAAAAPPAGPGSTTPAEPAPAVPEDYPCAQIGRQAVESGLALGDALAEAYGPALSALASSLGAPAAEGGAVAEMTAEEERDLLARQRDWLLARPNFHTDCNCSLPQVVAHAFIHDPADNPDAGTAQTGGGHSLPPDQLKAMMRLAGWVPLADVLDALRDDAAYLRWAMQQTHVGEHQPTKFTGACWAFADYLAERFAPTSAYRAGRQVAPRGLAGSPTARAKVAIVTPPLCIAPRCAIPGRHGDGCDGGES